MSDEEQGDVIWQNPVRLQVDANVVDPIRRLARIVRHKVTDATGPTGFRADEIHVELSGRDARGRFRWEDADAWQSVAEDSPFGCILAEGHAGKCDPDIPF